MNKISNYLLLLASALYCFILHLFITLLNSTLAQIGIYCLIPSLFLFTPHLLSKNFSLVSENNQVVGVDYPGQPPRYEWADGQDKVHFACRACNKLFALEDTTEDTPPAKAPKGFKVQGFEVMLYGICPECG